VTQLITAAGILRLVTDGRVDLDGPANNHLRTVRLADDEVTVREVLAHTAGVVVPSELFADTVPDLTSLAGPVWACRERGTYRYPNGGYAVLGQLIADVTGSPYPETIADLVLEPLGMTGSSFPLTWPHDHPGTVTGYRLTPDGMYTAARHQVCTMPATGGLWATAADLVRFATGWSTLLPDELAREALTPQADRLPGGGQIGLGWMLNAVNGTAGLRGTGPGFALSMFVHLDSGQACVALTNRQVPIETLNARLIRALTDSDQ
jgi:CubicO group peptidase (beta-lactamase class C family)